MLRANSRDILARGDSKKDAQQMHAFDGSARSDLKILDRSPEQISLENLVDQAKPSKGPHASINSSFWSNKRPAEEEEWEAETESLSEEEYTNISPSRPKTVSRVSLPEEGPSWLANSISYLTSTWGKPAERSLTDKHAEPDPDFGDTWQQQTSYSLKAQKSPPKVLAAEDIEGVLLWQDPARTGKVFAGGLYTLICLRQLVNGVELVQPSTVVAVALLTLMCYQCFNVLWRKKGKPAPPAKSKESNQAFVERHIIRAASQAGEILSASVSMTVNQFSGQSGRGSRIWLGLALWVVIVIGELGWLSQSTMAICAWLAIFGLPVVYVKCQAVLDALVDEACVALVSTLQAGQRGPLLGSAALGMVVFVLLDAKAVIRACVAMFCFFGTLFWQSHFRRKAMVAQTAQH